MGLFFKKKDKKEETAKAAPAKAPEAVAEKKAGAPSLSQVKVPTAAPKAEKTEAPAPKPIPTPKAPAKAPAKPAAKAPAKAAAKPAAKPAPKTAAAAPKAPSNASPAMTRADAEAQGIKVLSRPFFMKTEEDVRLAFDQAIADADARILMSDSKVNGKYEFTLEVDGYHFYLIANNGQILFDSPSFTTLLGALKGIETFRKTVETGSFDVKVDKYDRYRFILERKYYGENYTTKEQCQKCVDSVKNFASNSKILRFTPSKEDVATYEAAKNAKRTPEDVDWRAVELLEKQTPRMGKFEICREGDQFAFYLLANNGQILYASRYYAGEAACRRGVESFKRAAYVGNFFVDRDKFGNYRYVLKNIGSAPAFIGESYDNKPQCEKIIDSVKKFIVSASIELETVEA